MFFVFLWTWKLECSEKNVQFRIAPEPEQDSQRCLLPAKGPAPVLSPPRFPSVIRTLHTAGQFRGSNRKVQTGTWHMAGAQLCSLGFPLLFHCAPGFLAARSPQPLCSLPPTHTHPLCAEDPAARPVTCLATFWLDSAKALSIPPPYHVCASGESRLAQPQRHPLGTVLSAWQLGRGWLTCGEGASSGGGVLIRPGLPLPRGRGWKAWQMGRLM